MKGFNSWLNVRERRQVMMEYGFILALVVVSAVGLLGFFMTV